MSDLTYTLDEARAPQLGLIVLQSDETIEADMRRLLPGSAELLVSRIPSGAEVSPESLAAMEHDMTAAARLLPSGAELRVVGYGCTSGTATIGADRVAGLIRAGAQTPEVTEPVSALIAACRHLGLRKIALVSPYVAQVSDRLRAVLAQAGIEVAAFASFNVAQEARVVRIDAASIRAAAANVAGRGACAEGGCDGVFLSCTNLRTLEVIDAVEADLGLPVLSSNQVLAWHMARLAGLPATPDAPGRLWR